MKDYASHAPLTAMPLAMLEMWGQYMRCTLHLWHSVFLWQAEMANHHGFRRWHNLPVSGAALADFYGRRAHDVDVERI